MSVLVLLLLWLPISVLVGCLVGFVLNDRQPDESPNAVVYPLAWHRPETPDEQRRLRHTPEPARLVLIPGDAGHGAVFDFEATDEEILGA